MLIETYSSGDTCAQALADDLGAALQHTLEHKVEATLALSGGRSPQKVLPILAAKPISWNAVSVTLSDERCVGPTDPDSNAAMVTRCFLQKGAEAASFYPLWTDDEDTSNAVENINARLERLPAPIDVMYLGMGEDGHFASLFPCDDASTFDADTGGVVPGYAPRPPHQRISLSLKKILQTQHLFLHVTGAEKRKMFEYAGSITATPSCPVSLLINARRHDLSVYIAE